MRGASKNWHEATAGKWVLKSLGLESLSYEKACDFGPPRMRMEAWRCGDDALNKEGEFLTPSVGRQSAFLLKWPKQP